MSNKKSGVRKNLIVEKKADKCFSSWIWYALGALLLLAVLFFLYNGITGNAIRSFSFSDIQNAGHQLSPVIQFFLGGEYNGDYLFERVLFFLLILSLVFMVLKSMPLFKDDIGSSSKKIVILLSIIVSILSIRFINYEWLLTIFTTYSVLGATLMSILPFIIYYFFKNI